MKLDASVSGGQLPNQPARKRWAPGSAVPGNVIVGNF